MARSKGIIVRDNWIDPLLTLHPNELKDIFTSMVTYYRDGIMSDQAKHTTNPIWILVFSQLRSSITNSKNGSNGGSPLLKVADKRVRAAVDTSLFDRFWAAYPKKVGKEYAKKCFLRLKVDEALLNKMTDALAVQKQTDDWQRDGGRFIPNPSTWLNQGRWQDEGITVEKKKSIYDQFDLGVEL